jgi:hypothetical protein
MARKGGKRRAPRGSIGRAQKKRVARLSKPMKRAVKAIVHGEAETKRTNWYQSFNDGTGTTRATGFYSASGWAVQNNRISNNETDILRVIPTVIQGIDDFNRIGSKIRPTNLTVKGAVRIRYTLLENAATVPQNLVVDLYVMQHKVFKSYDSLYTGNNFGQMLEVAEGQTLPYNGLQTNAQQRVAAQNYQVLQRKRIVLRYAGTATSPTPQPQDHTWYAEYSLNLTKHLPKVLHYPETAVGVTPTNPLILNAPTNSSIFMCMGFVSWYNNPSNAVADPVVLSIIEQTYVSELSFKDT